jgi:hypothetical protein
MKIKLAIAMACLLGAGLAQAQSHSVANTTNPPDNQADSKAATKATPGGSATAARQDVHHTDQNVPSGKLRKAKPLKSKKAGSTATGGSKSGTESTMQQESSESAGNRAQVHAFDVTTKKQ